MGVFELVGFDFGCGTEVNGVEVSVVLEFLYFELFTTLGG